MNSIIKKLLLIGIFVISMADPTLLEIAEEYKESINNYDDLSQKSRMKDLRTALGKFYANSYYKNQTLAQQELDKISDPYVRNDIELCGIMHILNNFDFYGMDMSKTWLKERSEVLKQKMMILKAAKEAMIQTLRSLEKKLIRINSILLVMS